MRTKATACVDMVDIQSATTEIRWGKSKKKKGRNHSGRI